MEQHLEFGTNDANSTNKCNGCWFEIISVSREENFLPCSTEWDKSVYFTPSNRKQP